MKVIKQLSTLVAGAGISFLVLACATSPLGRKQMVLLPDSQLAAMGSQSFSQMKNETPVLKRGKENAYVRCIVDPIIRQLESESSNPADWEVVVFDEPKTINAFAVPGRKIGVYTGILAVAKTPDQLAAVLGHEVGHVLARHGNERVSETLAIQGGLATLGAILENKKGAQYQVLMAGLGLGAQFGVLLPHSRTQESEADIIGLELMAKAGFDPAESVELWKNMSAAGGGQPPEFMSTHPSHSTRINNLQENIPQVRDLYLKVKAAGKEPKCKN